MARCEWRAKWARGILVLGVGLAGCGRNDPAASNVAAEKPLAAPTFETSTATPPGASDSSSSSTAAAPTLDPRLHQTFADATLADPPASAQRPPDLTIAGKATGKLYTEVVKLWDTVKFRTADGKLIHYQAVLETDQGNIVIELLPDVAPNHVRSFVALATVGLYDGLVFHRTVREASPDQTDKLELIEGGCPVGTGELGQGSIGYWLKPEIDPQVTHIEGMVGASNAAEDDGDGCRFYVNLCKAPYLDGGYTVFGKVSEGLNVAKQILAAPVRKDAESPAGDRPVKPVVIRKVTIVMGEVMP